MEKFPGDRVDLNDGDIETLLHADLFYPTLRKFTESLSPDERRRVFEAAKDLSAIYQFEYSTQVAKAYVFPRRIW